MIRIITATKAQLPRVLEIEEEAISPPWSEGALTNELGREDGLFALAAEEDDILGFCIVRRMFDEAELYQVAVREDCRGRGIGGALVEAALRFCRQSGAVSIYLEVRRSNDAAIQLYKKYGFKNEGRRKNYYSSPVEDAVIMTLSLTAG